MLSQCESLGIVMSHLRDLRCVERKVVMKIQPIPRDVRKRVGGHGSALFTPFFTAFWMGEENQPLQHKRWSNNGAQSYWLSTWLQTWVSNPFADTPNLLQITMVEKRHSVHYIPMISLGILNHINRVSCIPLCPHEIFSLSHIASPWYPYITLITL